MRKHINNLIKILSSSSIFMMVLLNIVSFAVANVAPDNSAPTLDQIGPVLTRILNILIVAAGGVLVIMIAYGIWKSSLAAGDPRGLEGAKNTWTYALYGFFVVVGVFALTMIIEGVIGVSPGDGIIGKLVEAINELLNIPSSIPGTSSPLTPSCVQTTVCDAYCNPMPGAPIGTACPY